MCCSLWYRLLGYIYFTILACTKSFYVLLLQDRGNPDATSPTFNNIPFEAEFANDNADYIEVEDIPGVDGFIMSVDPLYKVKQNI